MKTVFLALVAFATASAFAKDKSLPTVTVKGELARVLVTAGSDFGATDAGMGHVWMSAKNVACVKKVSPSEAYIACSLLNDMGQVVRLSTADGADAPVLLRRVLQEITGAERKTDAQTREITATEIKCDVSGNGHDLDDIDYEPAATCAVTYFVK